MADGLRQIAALPDPVGEISGLKYRPSGIQVGQMRVPLGVVGIIYESRPNVTADAAGLCLKSGNAAILRGGSEALHSNQAIAACVHEGLKAAGLPETAVQVIETTDRAAVGELITMQDYVDVIVPRGGKGLIERSDAGVAHPDDQAPAWRVPRLYRRQGGLRQGDAHCRQRQDPAARHLQHDGDAAGRPRHRATGSCRRCAKSMRRRASSCAAMMLRAAIVPGMKPATEEDWYTEYLAAILAVRVVDGLDAAIEHITHYGSQHTDAIVTEDITRARRFLREVDSSSVMVNASTRFADGFEYGLGAEIGISTDKLHARGPVGLEGLTSLKYVVFGDGHIRS